MPYRLGKKDNRYCVFNKDTGENKGCSDSRKMAVKHMRALYAAEGGAKMGKKEALSDEVLDALVLEAVKEFELEYPDDPENQNKEMHYSDAGWLRPGITSFAELEQAMEEEERVGEMRDLISAYPTLASNILWSPDIADKPAALKQLADELGQRLQSVGEDDQEKEMKPNFFERIVSAVKERLLHEKEVPETSQDQMMIFKEGDEYRWIARYSNNFRDRDNPPEIISAESHRNFVEMVDKGLAPYPELWLWHVPEWKLGVANWLAYDDSGFAVASGVFSKGLEQVAEWLSTKGDIAVSHGMPPKSIVRDENDPTVIKRHQTVEISPLPSWAAANVLTGFVSLKEANMPIPSEKRKNLIEQWGMPVELVDGLEAANENTAKEAQDAGIESKEKTDTPVAEAPAVEVDAQEAAPVVEETAPETPPVEEEKKEQDEFPTRKEVAEAFANVLMPIVEKQNEAFEAITKQIEALSAEVETLKKSDTEKIADVAKEMPMASLSALIQGSIIGNKAVAVKEGSSLAEAKPKETEFTTDESPRTGIPFIDKMITPAGNHS